MNVDANTDDDAKTVLVEGDDVAVLATAKRDVQDVDLLEALSEADRELAGGGA